MSRIVSTANDPDKVSKHPFFPLLKFEEEWVKFRKGGVRTKKVRPLRYAARLDAAIYARYRSIISSLYARKLIDLKLQDIPIAYRKIPKEYNGNKSNIDFAHDIFRFISDTGSCYVTVVDIKSYFESLDHKIIKSVWETLVSSPLPADHLALYRSLTNYAVVDVDRLFERLQLHARPSTGNRLERRQRKIDALRHAQYKQICSPQEFRELVAGSSKSASLIQKNGFDFGIPQGTPISDLIANFYLIDFDAEVAAWVHQRGGLYRRYSDDIIVVLPKTNSENEFDARYFLQVNIRKHGAQLRIQDKKVCVVSFEQNGGQLDFSRIFGKTSRNGMEYLGFEYNGKSVMLRNSTLSNAWRRMKRRSYGHASRFVKRYRAKGRVWLFSNYPFKQLETKILRDVTANQDDGVRSWTFVKYVRRANRTFLKLNPRFAQQTKRYRRMTKNMIQLAFSKALEAHS